jgi:signal transduction histidine kinase/HPt (histidine-containing phosphotransfer) domain-containing protein
MAVISDSLAQLSKIFVAQLPRRLEQVVTHIQALMLEPWGPSQADPAHRLVHALTGSAGTFGLPLVSDAARPLELILAGLRARTDGPHPHETAAIDATLEQLLRVAKQELHLRAPSAVESSESNDATVIAAGHRIGLAVNPVSAAKAPPVIYIASDDLQQGEYLRQTLHADGYRVVMFDALDHLRAAGEPQEWPAAVIVCLSSHAGEGGKGDDMRPLAALRAVCPPDMPLILIAARDDIDARLAAYRAGVSRYMVMPVAAQYLLGQVARLILRAPGEPYRVLLVDDDPLLLQAMAEMLRQAGMMVCTEQSSLKALATLHHFAPDVLLLDVYMPDCNGTELAQLIREQDAYAFMPILFLSVETDHAKQALALQLGADDFLVKPVRAPQLVLAVGTRARRAREVRQRATQTALTTGGADSGLQRQLEQALSEANAAIELANRTEERYLSNINAPPNHADPRLTHQLEQALSEANAAIELANRTKARFLSNMSHELRTPLNAILGYAQLVQMDEGLLGESGDAARDGAQEIAKAGQHLLALINDVLDLAKIEVGSMEVTLGPVWLDELLLACQTAAAPMAQVRSIMLTFQHGHSSDVILSADGLRIKQVLLSFISNAIKYNRPGGSVQVTWHRPNSRVLRIEVTDSGVGMAQEQLRRLYTPFDRLGAEQGSIEGTGIGLVISRQLVEMMGGSIGVISAPGEGSTFWVELPLMRSEDLLSVNPVVVTQPAPQDARMDALAVQKKVLYIEDSSTNLRLMRKILSKRTEIVMYDASSAELGLPLAQSIQPDIILLDLNLPGMDGYQALKQLRQIDGLQHVPVVAVTANAMRGDAERGLSAGFAYYVIKPIDVGRFFTLLDHLLKGGTKETALASLSGAP